MINPIKDNRIVSDKTFAVRLLSFAKSVEVMDACSEDERDSFISYAKRLLDYQCLTVQCEEEKAYLERVLGNDYLRDIKIKTIIK
jgi:hypothetical protein